MRRIYLDNLMHYRFEKRDGGISLVRYSTENDPYVCPTMGDRPPFLDTEGEQVAWFEMDEQVEFIFSARTLQINDTLLTEKVVCGDDLPYLLRSPK